MKQFYYIRRRVYPTTAQVTDTQAAKLELNTILCYGAGVFGHKQAGGVLLSVCTGGLTLFLE